MPVPAEPKIYHIVHVDNLASIVTAGALWADARMTQRAGATVIGLAEIKRRRLRLPVSCHPGTFVGDYVPFYFCPRSLMLYVIHMANRPQLSYRGGQAPILHLEADLSRVIAWAEEGRLNWAVALSNAGSPYAEFRSGRKGLKDINWTAVAARDFRPPDTRHGKQAEFLLQHSFPWHLIERIGVHAEAMLPRVAAALGDISHRPPIEVRADWYY
jgi:hypothetical protein